MRKLFCISVCALLAAASASVGEAPGDTLDFLENSVFETPGSDLWPLVLSSPDLECEGIEVEGDFIRVEGYYHPDLLDHRGLLLVLADLMTRSDYDLLLQITNGLIHRGLPIEAIRVLRIRFREELANSGGPRPRGGDLESSTAPIGGQDLSRVLEHFPLRQQRIILSYVSETFSDGAVHWFSRKTPFFGGRQRFARQIYSFVRYDESGRISFKHRLYDNPNIGPSPYGDQLVTTPFPRVAQRLEEARRADAGRPEAGRYYFNDGQFSNPGPRERTTACNIR